MQIKTILKNLDRTQVAVLIVRLLNEKLLKLESENTEQKKILNSAESLLKNSDARKCCNCNLWYYYSRGDECYECDQKYCDTCAQDNIRDVCGEDYCEHMKLCVECIKTNVYSKCKRCGEIGI